MNSFVDYLNSMNNASSDTIAALAESQVNSPFFKKIQIDRNLGRYLSKRIRSGEHISVVLTGHAGDGKTSILVQILQDLGFLNENSSLEAEKEYDNGSISLYAVKDMSEIPENKQIYFCRKALDAPKNDKSSIIISNTGPLLKCLELIRKEQCKAQGIAFDECERIALQTKLLDQLDENRNELISVGDYQFLMINMARVDNVSFAREIMSKILSEDLWKECELCPMRSKCPIYFNIVQIRKYEDRVTSAIEAFYRYLYENDKRMTIRQILSQLSFALTGNLTCDEIKASYRDSVKFSYLFSNLFFGYKGIKEMDNADQIQGIAYAKELKLDTKGFDVDYKLFVTGDFSDIPGDIGKLVADQHQMFEKRHLNIDDKDNEFNTNDFEYRRAIRRVYIFFGDPQCEPQGNKYHPLYDELFGIRYNTYVRIQNGEAPSKLIHDLRNTITDALYIEMTGTSSKMARDIPLTIKRNDDYFQSVMITTDSFKKTDFKIEGTPCTTDFEDSCSKQEVYLQYRSDFSFRLSLPMVIYFGEIANGMISTISNPSLTHGLSKLKAMLKKISEKEANESEISVIVNNTDEPIKLKIIVEDNLVIEDN
ncbi:MAG: hypothetical protein LUI06_05910 [Ruminococcus sp.]|nr:hypothetical protein [Ruminococcus sp.]